MSLLLLPSIMFTLLVSNAEPRASVHTVPPENNITPPAAINTPPPAESFDNLFSTLKTYVNSMHSKNKRVVETLHHSTIPFVKIPLMTNSLCVYLGNDNLWEHIMTDEYTFESKQENFWQVIGTSIQDKAKDLIGSFVLPDLTYTESDWQELENIGLMISCNAQTKSEYKIDAKGNIMYDATGEPKKTTIQLDDYTGITIDNVDGLTHVWAPVDENDDANHHKIYSALLNKEDNTTLSYQKGVTPFNEIFELIDNTLIGGKNVYIHCNQGEHRSASIIVLYIQFRTQSTFENAWKYVQQYRTIIKPTHESQNRQTLMTTFSDLYNEEK